MMKSPQTVAVVMRRRNGNDPIGCGFGEGRASEFDVTLAMSDSWETRVLKKF
jgi:hypothetical protein